MKIEEKQRKKRGEIEKLKNISVRSALMARPFVATASSYLYDVALVREGHAGITTSSPHDLTDATHSDSTRVVNVLPAGCFVGEGPVRTRGYPLQIVHRATARDMDNGSEFVPRQHWILIGLWNPFAPLAIFPRLRLGIMAGAEGHF